MHRIIRPTFVSLFPLFLIVLNLGLKLPYLTSQEICLDEPFTIYHAQFHWQTIIKQLKEYNNPPLYELILHGWTEIFGIEPFSVRLLPTIFATLSPLALYYFANRFFSFSIAVSSSLILSFSSLLTFYAHDCRVYSLFVLLSILSNRYFLENAHPVARIKDRFLFVFFSSLLIYAHYFGFFVLFTQLVVLIFYYLGNRWRFLLSYLAITVLYLPQIFVMAERMHHSVAQGTWLEAPEGIESLYNMLWSFSNEPVVTVVCIALLLLASFLQIRQMSQIKHSESRSLVLLWFLFAFFGMYFISFYVPMYIPRYLLYALPAYCLLLSFAVTSIFRRVRVQRAALFILFLLFAFSTNIDPLKKHQISPAVEHMRSEKDKYTLVVVSPRDLLPNFAYHYNRRYFTKVSDETEYHLTDSLLKSDGIFFIQRTADLVQLDSMITKIFWINSEIQLKPQDVLGIYPGYALKSFGKYTDNLEWWEFVRR